MGLLRKHVPDEGAATTIKEFDDVRGLRFCEVFLIGGNAITKNLKAAVYNTTGLNYGDDPHNSCPDELVDHLGVASYELDEISAPEHSHGRASSHLTPEGRSSCLAA